MKARFIPALAAAVLSVAANAQVTNLTQLDIYQVLQLSDETKQILKVVEEYNNQLQSLYIADPATRAVITRLLEFHKQQTQESMLLMQRVMQLEGQLNALTARNCNCGTTNQEGSAR